MIQTNGGNTQLLQEMEAAKVRFMITGGVAVHFHNSAREFDDLDILVEPTLKNGALVLRALERSGIKHSATAADLAKPKVQIPLKKNQYADIITPTEGFDYQSAFENSMSATVNGISVRIMGLDDLITTKTAEGKRGEADLALLSNTDA